jgi:hypothetical protein
MMQRIWNACSVDAQVWGSTVLGTMENSHIAWEAGDVCGSNDSSWSGCA